MKRKTARNTLLASAAALTLSSVLFTGTTLAWFTETISTAPTILETGSLKAILEVNTNEGWKEVKETTDIFNVLADENGETGFKGVWEPGHAETAYLRIKNAGGLAFQYELNLLLTEDTPFTNAEGEDGQSLTDYIRFGLAHSTEPINTYASRQEAFEAMSLSNQDFSTLESIMQNDLLEPGDYEYIALTAYMPESTDNSANWNGSGDSAPSIQFKLSLDATQAEKEEDSYGSDYDEEAEVDRTKVLMDRNFSPINEASITENNLTGKVFLTQDVTNYADRIKSELALDLNTYTITSPKDTIVSGDSGYIDVSLANGTFETGDTLAGAIIVKPSAEQKAKLTFENINFISSADDSLHQGFKTSKRVLEYSAAQNSKGTLVFKDCEFDETYVQFQLQQDVESADISVIFENCTFNYSGSDSPISIEDGFTGSVTFKNCTFNLSSRTDGEVPNAYKIAETVNIDLQGNNTVNGESVQAE